MSTASRRMRWAGITAGLALVNMGIGLLVQRWLASRLGTTATADVFQAGVALPTAIATAFMAAIPTALIPVFVSRRDRGQSLLSRSEALGLASFALGLTAAIALSAGWLAEVLGSSDRSDIASFVRVSALLFPFVAAASVAQANLYSQNRFAISGSSGAANGAGLLLGLLLFGGSSPTITQLALCVVCGYVAQAVWVGVGFSGVLRGPKPTTAAALLPVLFLIGAYLVVRLQPVVERSLAVGLGTGSAATLGYASKVQQGLTLLAGFGLSVVALPAASAHAAAGALSKVARTLDEAFQLTAAATLIACSAGWALAVPIVQTVLVTGAFSDSDVIPTAHVIRAGLLVVAVSALSGPLVAVLYASQIRRKVVLSGLVALGVGAVASFALRGRFGINGIVVGSGLGSCSAFAVQLTAIRQLLRKWSPLRAVSAVGLPFAGLAMTTITFAVVVGRLESSPSTGSPMPMLLLLGVVFVVVCAPTATLTVLRVRSAEQQAHIAADPGPTA